jgi:Holliday junction DNA helicase RuvA
VIGRLLGKVVAEEPDGTVLVDVAGVGYEVLLPLGTLGRARADADGKVVLSVHTHVREDTFALFGFASEAERMAFRTLIGVSNVGPKTAIAVLSALPAADLARAIAAKDVRRLTDIPGIGKKTAERLLLELRDKLTVPTDEVAGPARSDRAIAPGDLEPGAKPSNADLLAGALTRMGYRAAEAERAIAGLGDRVLVGALPELVKEALVLLAK